MAASFQNSATGTAAAAASDDNLAGRKGRKQMNLCDRSPGCNLDAWICCALAGVLRNLLEVISPQASRLAGSKPRRVILFKVRLAARRAGRVLTYKTFILVSLILRLVVGHETRLHLRGSGRRRRRLL